MNDLSTEILVTYCKEGAGIAPLVLSRGDGFVVHDPWWAIGTQALHSGEAEDEARGLRIWRPDVYRQG